MGVKGCGLSFVCKTSSRPPPYAILVLLAVPLAFANPAKIYALVLMGEGILRAGSYDGWRILSVSLSPSDL